jgi:putative cardiolipin synthase
MKYKFYAFALSLCVASNAFADAARLLKDNKDAMQARADLIAQADKNITAEYFTVGNDGIGLGGLGLMRDAARRGVHVRILVDALSHKIPQAVLAFLRDEPNMEIKAYNPLDLLNPREILSRLHDKSICIDYGKVCITGGRNISDKYFVEVKGTRYNDLDVIFKGQASTNAYTYFEKLWKTQDAVLPDLGKFSHEELENPCNYSGEGRDCAVEQMAAKNEMKKWREKFDKYNEDLVEGRSILVPNRNADWLAGYDIGTEIEFLSDNPEEEKTDHGISLMLHNIVKENVKKSLLIISPYVVLTNRAEALLRDLRAKGIYIRILTNSLNASDNIVAQRAYIDNRQKILDMGIELWEYKGPDTMHAKAGVIDGEIALVGSWNFDIISNKKNREIGIKAIDKDLAAELTKVIEGFQERAYLIDQNGRPVNDDGNYGKAAAWKKITLQLVKVIRPAVEGLKKSR